MLEIGPNLQTFLLALTASAIPAAVTIATLWIQAKNSKTSRDEQLGEIHSAVNGNHSAVVEQVKDLKTAVAGMLDAQGPQQQASADQAGADQLRR